ncbi:hypothetical protein HDE_07058 [Halotydeus destructor]|nr:hypothetical protein HDE_07058 [Halotydeus destructor]
MHTSHSTDSVLYSIYADDKLKVGTILVFPRNGAYSEILQFSFMKSVTYEIQKVSRLTAPYTSSCYHFNKPQCVVDCYYLQESKLNCSNSLYPVKIPDMPSCTWDQHQIVEQYCDQKCNTRKDCQFLHYETTITANTQERTMSLRKLTKNNLTFVDVLPPVMQLSTVDVPSLTFTTFIIYLSGLVGIWYGVDCQTIKRVVVVKLRREQWKRIVSAILYFIALAHVVIELVAYCKYRIVTLTVYGRKEKLFGPRLCIRYFLLHPPTTSILSAFELKKLYSDQVLDNIVITDIHNGQQAYFGHDNISTLNLIYKMDSRGLSMCLDLFEDEIESKSLNAFSPAYRLFKMKVKNSTSNMGALYQISSPFAGSGFDSRPNFLQLINGIDRTVYQTVHSKLLPAPYPTMCYTYPDHADSCLNRCLLYTSYQLDKRLHHSAQTDISDTRAISFVKTINDDVITSRCSDKCKRPNCDVVAYQTEVRHVGAQSDPLRMSSKFIWTTLYFRQPFIHW